MGPARRLAPRGARARGARRAAKDGVLPEESELAGDLLYDPSVIDDYRGYIVDDARVAHEGVGVGGRGVQ